MQKEDIRRHGQHAGGIPVGDWPAERENLREYEELTSDILGIISLMKPVVGAIEAMHTLQKP